ncbi:hypothetical protein C5167_033249 [Papaver somniferum]|uniref:Major facilitator superfamily (MFS) profile domain-containing protein n=1 Tax=Papaver somniferum TaxID=3469 RepID=A0A4Y7KCN4_PAPSO|nr:hypothetical protein C5167_033249 [Papaver somniferum]
MGVVVYVCIFVMGFSPIPNILCSDIFSTRVRGSAMVFLAYWTGHTTITYLFPVLPHHMSVAEVRQLAVGGGHRPMLTDYYSMKELTLALLAV